YKIEIKRPDEKGGGFLAIYHPDRGDNSEPAYDSKELGDCVDDGIEFHTPSLSYAPTCGKLFAGDFIYIHEDLPPHQGVEKWQIDMGDQKFEFSTKDEVLHGPSICDGAGNIT